MPSPEKASRIQKLLSQLAEHTHPSQYKVWVVDLLNSEPAHILAQDLSRKSFQIDKFTGKKQASRKMVQMWEGKLNPHSEPNLIIVSSMHHGINLCKRIKYLDINMENHPHIAIMAADPDSTLAELNRIFGGQIPSKIRTIDSAISTQEIPQLTDEIIASHTAPAHA